MRKKSSEGLIDHEGIVQKTDTNSVTVRIVSESACSGCHAEGVCSIAGSQEKIINVAGKYDVVPGDKVTVLMKQSMGYKAIFLSYIIPLFIVIISLVFLVSFSVKELAAGLISIGVLVPYFLILFFFRKRINNSFTFTLKI